VPIFQKESRLFFIQESLSCTRILIRNVGFKGVIVFLIFNHYFKTRVFQNEYCYIRFLFDLNVLTLKEETLAFSRV